MSKKVNRKEFLGVGATLAAGMGFGGGAGPGEGLGAGRGAMAAADAHADLVVLNAKVITVDDAQPSAQAFAVKNDRFLAVGSSSDIRNLAGPNTKVIDATGMAVTPGFIDLHIHPHGDSELNGVNLLDNTPTIADAIRKLAAKAKETPPGYWVSGFGYDDTKMVDETGKFRRITRKDLDQASTERPIVVDHRGGHLAWYNSLAFKNAGVTVETADPPGGRIYKEGGELNGLMAERANRLMSNAGKRAEVTRESRWKATVALTNRMSAAGLTTLSDGSCSSEWAIAYQDAIAQGQFRVRMRMSTGGGPAFEGLKAAGIYSGFGNDILKAQSIKWSCDGSASGRSMAMSTPYVGRPNDYGILTMTQEELNAACEDAHRNGWQIEIHANGDKAIEMVLNAYERAMKLFPRPDPRHRIEHCTLLNPTLLRRLKELGVIPELFSTYVHYHGEKWAEYGEEKMKFMFPHRSCLDYGIPATHGSDYMPGPFEPLMGLQSCVTRKDMNGRVWGANQKITLDEAIRVSTLNGAHGTFEEKTLGSITAGKLADFVILAKDPHDVDPDTIKHIKVVRTVVGGKTMHEA